LNFLSLSDPSNIQWSKKNTFDENELLKNKKNGQKIQYFTNQYSS